MIIIIEIINELPKLLQYFVSGFIFLKILYFLNKKYNNDATFFTIWSIVVSFIIRSTVKLFDAIVFPQYELLVWAEVLICLIIAICSAFAIYKFINSKRFTLLLEKITSKSINHDLWRDVIDYEKGTVLKIFLKNQLIAYIGKLAAREEKGFDSWFFLTEYICLYLEKDEEFDSSISPNPSGVMIPLNAVERVELFYDINTDKFKGSA